MRTTREEDVPRLVPKIRGSDLTAGEQRAGPGILRQAEWVESLTADLSIVDYPAVERRHVYTQNRSSIRHA
jgi:hypothetical protein